MVCQHGARGRNYNILCRRPNGYDMNTQIIIGIPADTRTVYLAVFTLQMQNRRAERKQRRNIPAVFQSDSCVVKRGGNFR